MYTKFITKKPIGFTLQSTCLILDALIILNLYNTTESFHEKSQYKTRISENYEVEFIYAVNYDYPCQQPTSADISYFGQYNRSFNMTQEIQSRITELNDLNTDLFWWVFCGIIVFSIGTSFVPLLLDFTLSIFNYWRYKCKDTQKISFLRNMLILNWVLMQPLMLILTLSNNVSYKHCFCPQDLSLLIPLYTQFSYLSIFAVIVIIDIYFLLCMMVTQKNEISCCFLLYILFHSLICYTVLIYNAGIGSRKLHFILFIYKQWTSSFEIQKLYLEFYVVQNKHYNLRIQEAKFGL